MTDRFGLRRCVIALLLLLLVGCSSTTFFYNRLDHLLPWYIERYVDLDRSQRQLLDAQLAPLLTWHRREELPRYVALLDEFRAALDQPVTTATLQYFSEGMEDAWERLRDRSMDELLALGSDLSDEQVQEFFTYLDRRQDKLEDKYLPRDDEEFYDDTLDEMRDFAEDYLGRLSRQQRQDLEQAVRALHRTDRDWLAERAQSIALLRIEQSRSAGWQERVRTLAQDWESRVPEATQQRYDHNSAVMHEALAALIDGRSEKQDRRLRRRLDSLREDFEQLIAQATD